MSGNTSVRMISRVAVTSQPGPTSARKARRKVRILMTYHEVAILVEESLACAQPLDQRGGAAVIAGGALDSLGVLLVKEGNGPGEYFLDGGTIRRGKGIFVAVEGDPFIIVIFCQEDDIVSGNGDIRKQDAGPARNGTFVYVFLVAFRNCRCELDWDRGGKMESSRRRGVRRGVEQGGFVFTTDAWNRGAGFLDGQARARGERGANRQD